MSELVLPPRAVILDLNGTILDMEVLLRQDIYAAKNVYGLNLTAEDIVPYWGKPPLDFLRKIFRQPDGELDKLRASFRQFDSMFPKRPKPGVIRLLRQLDRVGVTRAISTSGPRVLIDSYLEQAGIPPEGFAFIHGKEETDPATAMGYSPLAPTIAGLARLGIGREETVFVGDEPLNLVEAREANLAFRAVRNIFVPLGRLTAAGIPAEHIASGPRALTHMLGIASRV